MAVVLEPIHYERSTCEHPVSAHEVTKGAGVDANGKPDNSDVIGACKVDRCTCDGTPDEKGAAAASDKAKAAKQAKLDELRAQLKDLESGSGEDKTTTAAPVAPKAAPAAGEATPPGAAQ